MNVAQLFAVLDADEESVRGVGREIGLTDTDMPSGLQNARAHVASKAHGKFGAQALEKIILSALPNRSLEVLLWRVWRGKAAEYVPRTGASAEVNDPNVRKLAAQLACAWNSPQLIDERMNVFLAHQLFARRATSDEAALVSKGAGESEEAPDALPVGDSGWKNEEYFYASADVPLPTGLTRFDNGLFRHQQKSVDALREWWADPAASKGVLCLPTGGGKTRTAVHFALSDVVGAQKVLWLTHRDELINQTLAAFLRSSHEASRPFELGRFARGELKVRVGVDVMVASIATLGRRRWDELKQVDQIIREQGEFGLVVVDECHHGVAKSWRRLIDGLKQRCPNMKLLGLSATPTRREEREKQELWDIFGDMIDEVYMLDLIQQKILAHPRYCPVRTGFRIEASAKERFSFERHDDPDLPRSMVDAIAANEGRNSAVIVEYMRRREELGATLIFAHNVEQGKYITRELRAKGVKAKDVYGTTPADERARVVQDFQDGELDVVVNVGLFTEGTDIPGVESVFLARPTTSKILFRQMVGRGLRGPKIGGSAECLIVGFYDEVQGLMSEALASSFRSEREACAALGLLTPESAEMGVEAEEAVDEPDDEALEDEIAALLGDLKEFLRKHIVSSTESEVLRLVGWWEVLRGGRRAFLPVFEDAIAAAEAFVRSIEDGRTDREAGDRLGLSDSVVSRFVSIARRPNVVPEYVALESATSEQIRGMSREVATVGEPAVTTRGDRDMTDQVAVLVDGQLETVDAANYRQLRDQWETDSARYKVASDPELMGALRTLLHKKNVHEGWAEDQVLAMLDAAVDEGSFPSQHSFGSTIDVIGLLSELTTVRHREWPRLIDNALASGLSEACKDRTDLLLVLLREASRGADASGKASRAAASRLSRRGDERVKSSKRPARTSTAPPPAE